MQIYSATTYLVLILCAVSKICGENGVSPATNAIDLFFNNNVYRNLNIADHPYQVHTWGKIMLRDFVLI